MAAVLRVEGSDLGRSFWSIAFAPHWAPGTPLSLRHIEEMMAKRGVFVDHATVHRWAIEILPVLAAVFRRR